MGERLVAVKATILILTETDPPGRQLKTPNLDQPGLCKETKPQRHSTPYPRQLVLRGAAQQVQVGTTM